MSKLLREYDEIAQNILDQAQKDGLYAVLRFHKREIFSLVYKNQAVDSSSIDLDAGLGMYVFTRSGHVAFGSTNQLTPDSGLVLYRQLSKIAQANQANNLATAEQIFEFEPQANLGQDKSHYQSFDALDVSPESVTKELGKLESYIKAQNPATSTLLRFKTEVDHWRIMRSDGTDVDWSVPKSRLYIDMSLADKSGNSSNSIRLIDTTPALLFSNYQKSTQIIDSTLKSIEQQLSASSLQPGNYPLLLDADLAGMLAHEALGHPAESDLVAARASVLADKDARYIVGTKVASDNVSIEDHESELAHGYHPYGAFGNQRLPVQIIENGILKESVSDVFTASKIGVVNKNCERSEAYYSPAIPRMSNTYINMTKVQTISHPEGSQLTDPEVLQSALKLAGVFKTYPTIIYLMKMVGGSVSTATGDFMFGTSGVYALTETGVTPHKPLSFAGNVLGALRAIGYGVGDVRKDIAGFCGKSGQTAHVNTGGNELIFFKSTKHVRVA